MLYHCELLVRMQVSAYFWRMCCGFCLFSSSHNPHFLVNYPEIDQSRHYRGKHVLSPSLIFDSSLSRLEMIKFCLRLSSLKPSIFVCCLMCWRQWQRLKPVDQIDSHFGRFDRASKTNTLLMISLSTVHVRHTFLPFAWCPYSIVFQFQHVLTLPSLLQHTATESDISQF